MSKDWKSTRNEEITTFGGLTRSALMSRVKSQGNMTTEERLANWLRREKLSGWRRRSRVFGKPDFVWRNMKIAVFVDGCFWHGHDCGRNLSPKTNAELWRSKILRNKERDVHVTSTLTQKGWYVIRIWECELKKHPQAALDKIRRALAGKRRTISAAHE